MELDVCAIQRGCVYDGPGIRTTVFLRECPFRCPWCCNPESIYVDKTQFIDNDRCLRLKGLTSNICNLCERNGGKRPLSDCPLGVCYPVSKKYNEKELISTLLKDKSLYKESGGGVTFSGGEPLLHTTALLPVLDALCRQGISVFFESTLMVEERELDDVLPYAEGFIVDLKLQPEMCLHSESYLGCILKRLKQLRGRKLLYRMVFVNSMQPYAKEVGLVLSQMGIDSIELLKCHNLAIRKYARLGLPFYETKSDSLAMNEFANVLRSYEIQVRTLSL